MILAFVAAGCRGEEDEGPSVALPSFKATTSGFCSTATIAETFKVGVVPFRPALAPASSESKKRLLSFVLAVRPEAPDRNVSLQTTAFEATGATVLSVRQSDGLATADLDATDAPAVALGALTTKLLLQVTIAGCEIAGGGPGASKKPTPEGERASIMFEIQLKQNGDVLKIIANNDTPIVNEGRNVF
jgi:hypothetical protein